jgi:ATP-dependent exoDNAse (exonuclease V) beta subunit
VIDRQTETFYCPVLGVVPEGYETARQAEKEELDRERIRLWYVAATRARELLVLPGSTPRRRNRPGSVSSICRSPTFPAWTSLTCRPVSRRRCARGQQPDARELRRRSRSHRGRADAADLARAQP